LPCCFCSSLCCSHLFPNDVFGFTLGLIVYLGVGVGIAQAVGVGLGFTVTFGLGVVVTLGLGVVVTLGLGFTVTVEVSVVTVEVSDGGIIIFGFLVIFGVALGVALGVGLGVGIPVSLGIGVGIINFFGLGGGVCLVFDRRICINSSDALYAIVIPFSLAIFESLILKFLNYL